MQYNNVCFMVCLPFACVRLQRGGGFYCRTAWVYCLILGVYRLLVCIYRADGAGLQLEQSDGMSFQYNYHEDVQSQDSMPCLQGTEIRVQSLNREQYLKDTANTATKKSQN